MSKAQPEQPVPSPSSTPPTCTSTAGTPRRSTRSARCSTPPAARPLTSCCSPATSSTTTACKLEQIDARRPPAGRRRATRRHPARQPRLPRPPTPSTGAAASPTSPTCTSSASPARSRTCSPASTSKSGAARTSTTHDYSPLADPRPRTTRWQIATAHGHWVRCDEADDRHRSWLIHTEEIAATAADYVALGHWPTAGPAGDGAVPAYYSGSPDLAQTVNVVRLGDAGVEVKRAPLTLSP